MLQDEHEHICHLAHMLDEYTSQVSNSSLEECTLLLPENAIYSYDFLDAARFTLRGSDGEYIIRSVSMIRSGGELTVMITGGKLADPEEALREAKTIELPPLARWKEGLASHPTLKREPVFLSGAHTIRG